MINAFEISKNSCNIKCVHLLYLVLQNQNWVRDTPEQISEKTQGPPVFFFTFLFGNYEPTHSIGLINLAINVWVLRVKNN